jgi:hypothetical protein
MRRGLIGQAMRKRRVAIAFALFMRKKPLGNILCLLWPDTLPPQESINRSPISAAKFF